MKDKIDLEIKEINQITNNYQIVENKILNQPFNLINNLFLQVHDDINEFVCTFCTYIVEKPIQCQTCEKIYCNDCIDKYNQQKKNECPQCTDTPFKKGKISGILGNMLGKLELKCPLDCGEIIRYSNIESHKASCIKIKVIHKCNLCNTELENQENLKEFHKLTCKMLKSSCVYCGDDILKFNYEAHLEKCPKKSIYCNECKLNIPSYFQEAHKNFFCLEIKKLLTDLSHLLRRLKL